VKAATLELGGHAPIVVAEDANIDLAVDQTIANKFRSSGQTCICANRVFVHDSVYKAYAKRLTYKKKAFIVENGLYKRVDIGPIINQDGYEKIVHHVDDAVDKGAHVLLGAEYNANEDEGYFFVQPTILKDVTDDMTIMQEETFGPVVPVTTFS